MPRILAVDWGGRRIGLALSDPLGVLASPLPTLEIRGEAEAVARVAEQPAQPLLQQRHIGRDVDRVGTRIDHRGETFGYKQSIQRVDLGSWD